MHQKHRLGLILLIVTLFTKLCFFTSCQIDQKSEISKDENNEIDTSFKRIYVSNDSAISVYKKLEPTWLTYIYKLESAYCFNTFNRNGLKKSVFVGNLSPFDYSQSEIIHIKKNGVLIEYFDNGKINNIRYYENDSLTGTVIEMDSTGEIFGAYIVKSDTIYKRYNIDLK